MNPLVLQQTCGKCATEVKVILLADGNQLFAKVNLDEPQGP